MSFDNQGTFSRVHSWEDDRRNDIDIMSDRHDEEDDNIAAALNLCFLRDGRVAMNGNLNMGNQKIINVAPATANGNAVNLKQTLELIADNSENLVHLEGDEMIYGIKSFQGDVHFTGTAQLACDVTAKKITLTEVPHVTDNSQLVPSTGWVNNVMKDTKVAFYGTNYIKYGSGLIMQWGISTGSVTNTFAIPFASTDYRIVTAYEYGRLSDSYGHDSISGKTTTGFSVNAETPATINWLAIGF